MPLKRPGARILSLLLQTSLLIALALPALPAPQETILIRNITIHPVSAPDIPNGSILLQNGKIAGVGARLTAPKGARIVEGQGLHAYPGMIDSATQ
jgi:imidazolonepropionase-like amidohydrolase